MTTKRNKSRQKKRKWTNTRLTRICKLCSTEHAISKCHPDVVYVPMRFHLDSSIYRRITSKLNKTPCLVHKSKVLRCWQSADKTPKPFRSREVYDDPFYCCIILLGWCIQKATPTWSKRRKVCGILKKIQCWFSFVVKGKKVSQRRASAEKNRWYLVLGGKKSRLYRVVDWRNPVVVNKEKVSSIECLWRQSCSISW